MFGTFNLVGQATAFYSLHLSEVRVVDGEHEFDWLFSYSVGALERGDGIFEVSREGSPQGVLHAGRDYIFHAGRSFQVVSTRYAGDNGPPGLLPRAFGETCFSIGADDCTPGLQPREVPLPVATLAVASLALAALGLWRSQLR